MGKRKNMEEIDAYSKGYIDASITKQFTVQGELAFTPNNPLGYKIDIKCKNKKQKDLLKMLKDESKQICFVHGSAGSGKSYISLAYALSALKDENTPYEKIIIIIPTLQAVSQALNLGYLKGDLNDKTMVYLSSDNDTMEKILRNSGNIGCSDIIGNMVKNGKIEYRFPHFLRGSNLDHCLIMINEAEGFDKNEMLLLLTRIGEDSKIIISGDEKQAVRRDFKDGSGMKYALEHLDGMDEVGSIEFTDDDIVRNPLISKIFEHWG